MEFRKLIKNLLFIDIETVSGEKSYDLLPERLQHLWKHKVTFLKNEDEKSIDEFYFEKAGIYAEYGKIITIGVGFFYWDDHEKLCLKVKSLAGDSEKELLEEFKYLIEEKFNPKLLALCAHNGKEFDFPYICRRMLVNGITLPFPLDIGAKKPWEVPHFDTLEMWKFGDKKHYTSLELMATLFGIQSSKSNMAGNEVNTVYYNENNLDKIREYCIEDVVVLAQLFLKLKGFDTIDSENIERLN